jgi:hypothetical protein
LRFSSGLRLFGPANPAITSVIWSHHQDNCIFIIASAGELSSRCAASLSGRNMSKASQWGIAVGVLIAIVGLITMAAGFGSRQSDPAPVAAGLAIFALGLLSVSASFYFQARSIKSQLPADASMSAAGRRRPSCDICGKAPAVIQCTMHKTSLCPTCLSTHYDSRGCVYVPSIRRTSAKSSRRAAASRS